MWKFSKRDEMWQHGNEATEKLLEMSIATVKRKTGSFVKARKPRGISTTKPSHLKEIIPIFTGPWKSKPPGYGQIDTVVHCGNSLRGDMVYSVNYTDVATLWVSFSAQWNKGQEATQRSLSRIKQKYHLRYLECIQIQGVSLSIMLLKIGVMMRVSNSPDQDRIIKMIMPMWNKRMDMLLEDS